MKKKSETQIWSIKKQSQRVKEGFSIFDLQRGLAPFRAISVLGSVLSRNIWKVPKEGWEGDQRKTYRCIGECTSGHFNKGKSQTPNIWMDTVFFTTNTFRLKEKNTFKKAHTKYSLLWSKIDKNGGFNFIQKKWIPGAIFNLISLLNRHKVDNSQR